MKRDSMKLLRSFSYDIRKNRALLFMLLPAVLFFLVFAYVPMSGIVLAFKSFDYSLGIFNSPWVGFKNFTFFFMSGKAFLVTKNTLLYNIAFIILGTTLQVSLAIFLSELGRRWFKKITQAFMFLPYFVSWVIVGAFVYNIFNYNYGTLNTFLKFLGLQPIDVNGTPWLWKYILVFFSAWKYSGYGSIIYLAAIMNIDMEMYEASDIDGATIFQKVRFITLPCLRSTIIIMTLLSIGNIFRGDFNMFYQIIGNNGLLFDSTDVIDTFVFRSLLYTQEFGMAAAAGLYQSVLCFVVLALTNWVIRSIDKENSLF